MKSHWTSNLVSSNGLFICNSPSQVHKRLFLSTWIWFAINCNSLSFPNKPILLEKSQAVHLLKVDTRKRRTRRVEDHEMCHLEPVPQSHLPSSILSSIEVCFFVVVVEDNTFCKSKGIVDVKEPWALKFCSHYEDSKANHTYAWGCSMS